MHKDTEKALQRLEKALLSIPKMPPIAAVSPRFHPGMRALSIREAMLSPAETIPVAESRGRILSAASVGCPPAVPILICGERIDDHAISCFEYYGIESCSVVRE